MNTIKEEASKKVSRPEQLMARYFNAVDNHISNLATQFGGIAVDRLALYLRNI